MEASGSLALAPYHASYGLPVSGFDDNFDSSWGFDTIATLEGAETVAAVDGASIVFLPYGGCAPPFRPTKKKFFFMNSAGDFNTATVSGAQDYATCDIDEDTYTSRS